MVLLQASDVQATVQTTVQTTVQALPWVDKMGLGFLVVFLLLGAWRGLWWQIVRLTGVVLAVLVARSMTPRWVGDVESSFNLTEGPAYGLTWFTIFVLGLVVAAFLGRLGKHALETMQLGAVDRLGGALAGALTGLVLHGALLLLLTGLGTTDWSTHTLAGSKSERLLDAVSNRWPLFVDAKVRERIVGPWVDALGLERPKPETATEPNHGPDLEREPVFETEPKTVR